MSSGETAGPDQPEHEASGLAAETAATAGALAAETAATAGALAAETAATADALAAETAARAFKLASALDATLVTIAGRLDRYAVYGQRSRRIIIALAVSFALDIILTIILGFTAFSAHSTASTNASLVSGLHTAQVQLRAASSWRRARAVTRSGPIRTSSGGGLHPHHHRQSRLRARRNPRSKRQTSWQRSSWPTSPGSTTRSTAKPCTEAEPATPGWYDWSGADHGIARAAARPLLEPGRSAWGVVDPGRVTWRSGRPGDLDR